MPGNWHTYPEMAAAGLWTTAGDLLRFGMAVQAAMHGKPGGRLTFSHGGRDEGFDADFAATAFSGQGVAIMINANDNSGAVRRIHEVVSALYRWPLERVAPTPPVP